MFVQASRSLPTLYSYQSSFDSSDSSKEIQKIALQTLTPKKIACNRYKTTEYQPAPSMLGDTWRTTWDSENCFLDSIPFKYFCNSCKSYRSYVIDKILENYKNECLTDKDLEAPYRNNDLSLMKFLLPKTKTKELIKLLQRLSFSEIEVGRDTTMGRLILDTIKNRISLEKDLSNKEGLLTILIRPRVFQKPCDYDLPMMFIQNIIKHKRKKELNKGFPMEALFEANFKENLPARLKLLTILLEQNEVASNKKHLQKALRAATLAHRAHRMKEIKLLISFEASLMSKL